MRRHLIAALSGLVFVTLSGVGSVFLLNLTTAGDGSLRLTYLYASPASADWFQSSGGNYGVILDAWRGYFGRNGTEVREISRPELLSGLTAGVLILPSAVALDEDERRAIERFLKNGGSVFATWATGSRNGSGQWVGYDFVKEVLGIRVVAQVEKEQPRLFLAPSGGTPVTYPVQAGHRIWLGPIMELPLRIEAKYLAGQFTDWSHVLPEDGKSSGAIAYDERLGGRVLYFGFAESSWEFGGEEVDKLVAAGIAWLKRMPRVFKAAWPSPYQAAQLIEMDTEWQFENATKLVSMLDEAGIRGTFYCLTSEAVKFPNVVRQIAQRHEVAYHAEVHNGFRDLPGGQQETRLDTMIAEMASIMGDTSRFTGFRAPLEQHDQTTEILLRQKGIRHHAASPNSSVARLPRFSSAEPHLDSESALVVLPRTQRDDISLVELSRERVEQALLQDFHEVMHMGAFGLLSLHTQNFGEGAAVAEATSALLNEMQKYRDRVWFAPGGEIASWWRERERVSWRAYERGDNLDLEINVRGPGEVKKVAFVVTTPETGRRMKVMPSKVEYPNPNTRKIDEFRVEIRFDVLKPGSFRYAIRLY